ncbi:hypothetical protein [Mycobacterium kansasii]|uniref:hypothetical protein n=1 Tax=Mycobacterium kansasii TaxID=1768 RepID=UPI0028058619|nr:hypothetical protein [Mycobacterium kansasii]
MQKSDVALESAVQHQLVDVLGGHDGADALQIVQQGIVSRLMAWTLRLELSRTSPRQLLLTKRNLVLASW